VKIRTKTGDQDCAAHLAVCIPPEGTREVMDTWIQEAEGAQAHTPSS
jgi:transposase-like protein